MSDDQFDEAHAMAEVMCEIGRMTAATVPTAINKAAKFARKFLPPDAPEGHIACAAARIVAIAMMTNSLLLTERTEREENFDEAMAANIEAAKNLLSVGKGRRRTAPEEDPTVPAWLDDATLRKMFEEAN